MPLSRKSSGPSPGALLAWQILAPVAALFTLLLILAIWLGKHHFEPLALQRDLLRAERYAKFSAVVFAEHLPKKTPRELSEDFRAAGLDTLEFLPPGQTPPWPSPHYVAVGPYVEAWSPVTGPSGANLGTVRIRRQADSLIFVTKAVHVFALTSCTVFALLLALGWVLFKRRVINRLDGIIRETGATPGPDGTRSDALERAREAVGRALAEAKNSEQHLRRLLDGHSELACIATPEGRLVDANEAYCRYFGKTREELLGTSCIDLVHPAYRMEVVNRLQSLSLANPKIDTEHAVIRGDGTTSWVQWHAAAISSPDGGTKQIFSFRTDITARKNVEERLESLRRAFDQMQSLAETGSITWDLALDAMEWTTETRRLLGVDRSAPASLDGLLAVISPDECENVRRLFVTARKEGREFQHEFRTVLPDGSLRVLQSRAEVLADPKTKLLNRLTCTLRDITALRDAEAATKRELRFREAIEQSLAAGIVVSDDKGRNQLVNPAFCQMTGWSEKELVGISVPYPYWPEEEIPAIKQAFEMAIAGKTPPSGFELRFCRKDGTRFDVLIKVAPLLDSQDKQLGWLGAVSDISSMQQTRRELVKAESQLRQQLSYLQAVEKGITVGLITIGADGLPSSVNDAYCEMLGYSRDEVLAMTPPYPIWPEEDRDEIRRAFNQHLKGESPAGGFQLRFKKKDGSMIDVLITAASLRGEDGAPMGTLSALTNISPLKAAKRRLDAVNERLRIAQDVAEFGIWDWDPVADTLFWDQNSFAMFGHPEATDPDAVWRIVISEEERERLTYELKRLIASGGASGQDRLRPRWPDGSVHEILSTYVIRRDATGHAIRVLGVNRDVTAEVESERELRTAQERLAAALEGGHFGTFEHIVGLGDLNWNQANYEINGIDPSITEASALFAAWKESTGEFFPKLMAQMDSLPVTQNQYAYEFESRPTGREPRRVRVSIFIERNPKGHPVRLVGISRRVD